ncbi:unnamed protein product [Nippostrongylus brasiliensis]|uniref:Aldehyde dehydrogenase n=1 Tax=Nippostrongylus brasiliensis TaxID=27835 RepID=A0A0N4Y7Q7_NIPBR|nr:unnamed protein product [Nippostrongylus brasiliensis]
MMIEAHRKDIGGAIYKDLGRDPSFEIAGATNEINEILDNMDKWNAPVKVPKPLNFNDEDDEVLMIKEPLGVTLVIAAWSFPLITSMPFVAALAAGNTVILKLSEYAPNFSEVFSNLLKNYFDKHLIAAVEGGVSETTALLAERFDYIMYTGNSTVGRIVMTAAAKNLTPLTLELGGKNPVVVEPDADLDDAAKKLIFSKTLNCGQNCLSSDYVSAVKWKLIAALRKNFDAMAPFKENKAFARIVNEKHFDLLVKTKGQIVYRAKEETNKAERFLPPHVLIIEKDDVFMQEEIFGPLLPILALKSFDEAVAFVNAHEKPLGAYIFTKDPEKARRFLLETSSGGVTVNDVMTHAFVDTMPFGGVGNSGMGRVSGKYGFDNFVHEKPILMRNGIGKKVLAKL